MCHALLQDSRFFRLLLHIDIELAAQSRAGGCQCGGVLHCANYPRKPRACLSEMRAAYESRFSFCCHQCRKRATSMSVRFLGRRVYLGLAVVLMLAGTIGASIMLGSDSVRMKQQNSPLNVIIMHPGFLSDLFGNFHEVYLIQADEDESFFE